LYDFLVAILSDKEKSIKYMEIFKGEECESLEDLNYLTEEDYLAMGIPRVPMRKIISSLKNLYNETNTVIETLATSIPDGSEAAKPKAEEEVKESSKSSGGLKTKDIQIKYGSTKIEDSQKSERNTKDDITAYTKVYDPEIETNTNGEVKLKANEVAYLKSKKKVDNTSRRYTVANANEEEALKVKGEAELKVQRKNKIKEKEDGEQKSKGNSEHRSKKESEDKTKGGAFFRWSWLWNRQEPPRAIKNQNVSRINDELPIYNRPNTSLNKGNGEIRYIKTVNREEQETKPLNNNELIETSLMKFEKREECLDDILRTIQGIKSEAQGTDEEAVLHNRLLDELNPLMDSAYVQMMRVDKRFTKLIRKSANTDLDSAHEEIGRLDSGIKELVAKSNTDLYSANEGKVRLGNRFKELVVNLSTVKLWMIVIIEVVVLFWLLVLL